MGNTIDPFAAAGFAPVPGQPAPTTMDPFQAAGFAPVAPTATPPAMPTPIGTDEYGTPIFDQSTDEGKAAGADARRGPEKVLEGATFGMLPQIGAGMSALAGNSDRQPSSEIYADTLKNMRDYTAQTSKDNPVASGVLEGGGGLIPTLASFGAAGPLIQGAARAVPAGGAMARALLSGAFGGANAAGHDVGTGETSALGSDTAKGVGMGALLSGAGDAVGRGVVQPLVNMGSGLYQGIKNVATNAGREGVVGQILREVSGGFPDQAATAPVPGLTLRAAQATGNPGVAALERTMASDPGVQSGVSGDAVKNGYTPNQMDAVRTALVGSDAGIEPSVLTNQASSRGVKAIQDTNDALGGVEKSLWTAPVLKNVQLNGPGIAAGVSQDVAGFPASWRDAVTGPQNKLGSYLNELHELGDNASIPDVNSVRSRLLGVARDAASGPQPDSVTAAAANKMAGSILDRMGSDPGITGTAPSTKFFMTEPMQMTHVEVPDPVTIRATAPAANSNVSGGDAGIPTLQSGGIPSPNQFAITHPIAVSNQVPTPIHIRASSDAGSAANPDAWNAYQTARDFTRGFNNAKGYDEFNNILHPNSQGNMQGNPEKQFGQFFDTTGGTTAGLERLKGLVDFARQSGLEPNAREMEGATGQYLKAAILRQARAGNGLDMIGQPATNPATLASTANKLAPALNATPASSAVAPDVQAAGNAAELLNRPSTLRGDTNSTTYEKLRNHDLVSAIVGQSGSSALGAAAGGYAGYRAGEPLDVPARVSVPLGMLAGATGGRFLGPAIGRAVSHIPLVSSAVTGPSNAIQHQLWESLADLPSYQRAIATPMLTGPGVGQPGMASTATRGLARALLEPVTAGGGR